MRFITGLAFIGNVVGWLFLIMILFVEDGFLGTGGLIGLIGFFIAYSVREGFAVSVADYIFQPEWDVFKQKIKWANGVGFTTGFIGAALIMAIFS